MSSRKLSRSALLTAGGVLTLGAAVLGGHAWGQDSGAAPHVLAAGPAAAGAASSTNWVTQVAQSSRNSVVSVDVTNKAAGQRQGNGRQGGINIGGGGISIGGGGISIGGQNGGNGQTGIGGGTVSGGTGTGILLDSQGDILTNDHVVTLDFSSTSTTIQVGLANGKSDTAQLVGQDQATDLAVIRIPAADVAGLTPIQWADPSSIQVGEPVVAIGYALDLGGEPTVTSGVVSAVDREIDEQNATISGAVQTDAAINPGNSGGPLLDENGQVIGINTAGLVGTAQQPASGINFAISVQTAQNVAQTLIKSGSVSRGYLGVSVTNVTAQDKQSGASAVSQGAGVEQVSSSSPAAQAGLQQGDVITKVGNTTINNTGDLTGALAQDPPGTTVTVTFYRGSNQQSVQVTLGQRPNS